MDKRRERYLAVKAKIIDYLGGECVECGSVDQLQIDHKDHTKKNFNVTEGWSFSWERIEEELKLCQLLCKKHHKEKTLKEGSLTKSWSTKPRQEHGTVWSYHKYKCRCDPCRAAKKEYEKRYA